MRKVVKLHSDSSSYDNDAWSDIESIKFSLAKNTDEHFCTFDSIKLAIKNKNLKDISRLQIKMNAAMEELRALYKDYSDNQV